MADNKKEANIIIRAKDEASAVLKKIGKGFVDMKEEAALASAVILGFLGLSVKNYAEAEKASRQLTVAIKNQGLDVEKLTASYTKLAVELQKNSEYGDDQIIQGIALAQANAGNLKLTDELIRATIDFAAAKEMDLNSAFEVVGKSIGTETNALGRYGVALEDSMTASQKMAAITTQLAGKYDGFAEANLTAEGRIKQLTNVLGDLTEMVGKELSPYVERAAKVMTDLAFKVLEGDTAWVKYAAIGAAVVAGLLSLASTLGVVIAVLPTVIAGFEALAIAVNSVYGVIGLLVVATSALAVAWQTDFGNIQGRTYASLKVIGQLFRAFADDLGELILGLSEMLSGLATLDFDRVNQGIERLRQKSKAAALDMGKAYADAYKQRAEELKSTLKKEEKAEGESAAKKDKIKQDYEKVSKARLVNDKKTLEAELQAIEQRYADDKKALVGQYTKDETDQKIAALDLAKNQEIQNVYDVQAAKIESYKKTSDEEKAYLEEIQSKSIAVSQEITKAQIEQDQKRRDAQLKALNAGAANPFSPDASALGAGVGVLNASVGGEEGARKLVVQGAGAGISAITGIPGLGEALGPFIEAATKGPEEFSKMLEAFAESLPEIAASLTESIVMLMVDPNFYMRIIKAFVKGMSRITASDYFGSDFGKKVSDLLAKTADFSKFYKAFSDKASKVFDDMFNVISEGLKNLFQDLFGEKLFDAIAQPINRAWQFISDFYTKIGEVFVKAFNQYIELGSKIFDFIVTELPGKITEAFNTVIAGTVTKITEAIDGVFSGVSGILNTFTTKIESFGNSITNAFNKIGEAINDLLNIDIGGGGGGILSGGLDNDSGTWWSKGGMIPKYAANGVFVPRGTDTVPAMLSPGEFVVNSAAASKNMSTLKAINSGQTIGSDGGGSIIVNVYGGLLGDAQSARQLARAIDRELFKMRKSGEGVAFDKSIT